MALYVGETILITHTATFGDVALTDDLVSAVTVTIYDSVGDVVVTESTMVWDDTTERWEYVWDTSPSVAPGGTALDPGAYRAKVYVLGLNNEENWEYKKIRLKVNPV